LKLFSQSVTAEALRKSNEYRRFGLGSVSVVQIFLYKGTSPWIIFVRISIENRHFCSNGVRSAQHFRQKWSSLTNRSLCQKTRINILSYGVKISAECSFVLSQSTCLTDRQTDRQISRG